jgi:hypothetical protein
MLCKYTFSADDSAMARIDEFCRENGLTRSKFIVSACTDYINAKTIEPELKKVLDDMSRQIETLVKKSGSAL